MTPTVSDAAELLARWDFEQARPLLEDLVARLPAADLDGLSARRMLAEVLRELGEPDEAYPLAVEAARECRRRYGPAHPSSVRAGVVLGTVLHDRGALDEAEREYRAVVDAGARPTGPGGRAVLLARANLALLHRDLGDPDGAVRELTAAFRAQHDTYGPGDPDTIRLATALGRLHADLGDRVRAGRVLAAAAASARTSLGPDHPLTALVDQGRAALDAPDPSPAPAPSPRAGSSPAELPFEQPVYRPDRKVAAPVETPAAEPLFADEPWGWAVAEPPEERRWGLRLALIGAALLAAVGALAAGLVLRGHGGPPAGPAGAAGSPVASAPPSAAAPSTVDAPRSPPGDVTLDDNGTSITVTWTDPSHGTGTVLLAFSRGGQAAGPLRPLPAGTQKHVLGGLDPTANYCVIIAIVYPGDAVARADQVCTARHG